MSEMAPRPAAAVALPGSPPSPPPSPAPEVKPPHFDCEAAWKEATRAFRKEIGLRLSNSIALDADYNSCLKLIESASRRTSGERGILHRTASKCIDILQTFDKAISTCCQAKPEVTCFVWGSVQAIIAVAEKYRSCSERIAEMLKEITKSIPRLEKYMVIFPTNLELQARLVDVYKTFLNFSAVALKFFNSKRFIVVLKMTWSSLNTALDSTAKNMTRHMDDMEKEAGAAHIGASATERNRAEERHSEILGFVEVLSPGREPRRRLRRPITIVPYPRNTTFVGRGVELAQLDEQLAQVVAEAHANSEKTLPSHERSSPTPTHTGEPRVVTICGQGGMGKTQLALELLYQNRYGYDARFWISSESKAIIEQDFAKIGHRLTVELEQPPAENTLKGDVDSAKRWMETTEDTWLLVFDNVDDINDIYEYLPKVGRGLVVVTTRDHSIADTLGHPSTQNTIRLKGMDKKSSLKLLHQFIPNVVSESLVLSEDNDQTISQILKDLGGLPLCICQMGCYIRQKKCTPQKYLAILSEQSDRLYNDASSISTLPYSRTANGNSERLDRTIASCCNMSLDLLSDQDRYLFGVLAFYQTDKIQEKIITKYCSEKDRLKHLDDEWCWNETLSRLEKNSLITIDEAVVSVDFDENELDKLPWITPGIATCRTISIHRVLKRHALHILSTKPELLVDCFSDAAYLLNMAFPNPDTPRESTASDNWFQSDLVLPHILSLKTAYELTHSGPHDRRAKKVDHAVPSFFIKLLGKCSWYMFHRGSHDIHKFALGTVDSVVDSLKFGTESLEIARKFHSQRESNGHRDDLLLGLIGAVGGLCDNTFHLRSKACDLTDEAISIQQRTYDAKTNGGPTPNYDETRRLLICYSNAVDSNIRSRRWQRAHTLLDRAEGILRLLDEARSPRYLSTFYFLRSQLKFQQGHHVGAIEDSQRALTLLERALDSDHWLALYRKCLQARMEGAIDTERGLSLGQEVFAECIRVLGSEHKVTGQAHYMTCTLQQQLGQLDNALSSVNKSIETFASRKDFEQFVARSYFRKKLICGELGQHDEAAEAHRLAKYYKDKFVGAENSTVVVGDTMEDYDLLVDPWDC